MQRLNRPILVVVVLAAVIAGFTAYFTLNLSILKSGPTQDDLWPGTASWAEEQLSEMSLEEKVSQLFSVRAYSHYESVDDPDYRKIVDFVERFGIGGVTFFQGDPMEQASLANDLQGRARVPLLISQDMEWGAGMRIEHTTTFPRTMALGATRDKKLAYMAGYVTAREARALGTQQVFAPVADINNNPFNPIINVRSFGEKPELVAEMAGAFAMGVQAGGAIATAKHFPGHGDTATDSHASLPILPFGMDRLETVELIPFRELVDNGIMSIMIGHLAFPQVEPDSTVPATLSSRVTTEILRKELDFDGLIVTDALDMAGVTVNFSTGDVALRAFKAGADMLLLSEDPYTARAAILRAIEAGEISERRVDASVTRILRAKAWAGLAYDSKVELENVRRIVASEPHLAVSETIARKSLTLLRNENGAVPIRDARRVLVVTLSDGSDPTVGRNFTSQLRGQLEGAAIQSVLLDDRSSSDDYERVLASVGEYDVIVVPAFVYVRSWSGRINLAQKNLDFLNTLVSGKAPVVLVSFGNPYIVIGLSQPDAYIAAYGASDASQAAVADALTGRAGFQGRLPITIPDLYNYGEGIRLPQTTIRRGYPAEAGMSGDDLRRVDSLLHAAIEDGAFPGAAVAIGRGGVLTKLDSYGYFTYENRTPITTRSRFDMASLTKVISTTTAAMKLVEEDRLDLEDHVVEYLPEFGMNGKEKVRIRHLLTHSAGLIPFRTFHKMGVTRREALIDSIMAEKLIYTPGTDSRYSDFSMITLMLVIEKITGRDFASYAEEEIFKPLGMVDTGFLDTTGPDTTVVPTEVDAGFRNRLIQGEVHDETAWILGGTSGHAGLFSTVEDLSKFAYMLLNDGEINGRRFLNPETIRKFTRPYAPKKHTRAMGWDTPSRDGYTSAGRHFGPKSFGHTGFTGTSMWLDPEQDLFVILLTNRVYPTRENSKITQIRPKLADIAQESILGPPELVLGSE
ncbi:MAG: glycoside hydrolase family 3 N-terminal domain-containing protein [Rhodothermales bacterium]